LAPLKKELGEDNFNKIELVEADLTDKQSIINACAGVTIIIHVASPIGM
jgi:hypothetical protein